MATLCLMLLSDPGKAERDRISKMPEVGDYSEADIEKEIIFGREMSAILLAKRKLSDNRPLNRYLNLVGQSIVRHSNRSELSYYFAAVESSQINAYAVPGGYIFITTAALDLMQNEAELAGVLAHEIAHVSSRHIVEALKIRANDESMVALFSTILSQQGASAKVVFYQAIDHAFELLFSKGLVAASEYQADTQGTFLAASAGYDASAYYRYLERISAVISPGDDELDSTHPPFSLRISRLKALIENQGLNAQGNTINEKRFASFNP